jgi:fermentation-respiration switch protein FrsA (DUF1100 family)
MSAATEEPGKTERKYKPAKPPAAWYWYIPRVIALIYVAMLVFLFFAQGFLIFPGRGTQGNSTLRPWSGTELLELKAASGEKVAALFAHALTPDGKPHPDAAKRPTLLFFYGNAMCLSDAREDILEFQRLGANVLVPDYCGYGMSEGTASEAGCYATADAAYAHLLERKDIDPKKIVVSGWSLGGAVAIDLASRKQPAGLAVFSTFTSMANMGNATYPFMPSFMIGLILKNRFESESKIGGVKCPILVGHSRGDSIIPFSMSDRLAAAAGPTTARLILEKPDHSDFFAGGGDQVSKAIGAFIETVYAGEKDK